MKMLVSEIISGGNEYKASSYALNTRLLIDGIQYKVVNYSATSSKYNREFLKIGGDTESELMEVIRNYGLDIENLKKKLSTAVEALNYIVSSDREGSTRGYWEMKDKAKETLAEIGGKDEKSIL